MCPVAHGDGHDAPGLCDEAVPVVAAVIDDVVVIAEDAVRQPVVAHELPDILHDVELGHLGGSGSRVMLSGTATSPERCHPA